MIPRTQSYPSLTQQRPTTEVNIGELELFQQHVVMDLNSAAADIARIDRTLNELAEANRLLTESLNWVGHYYPEVIDALKSTVNVTVALDRSNAQAESV